MGRRDADFLPTSLRLNNELYNSSSAVCQTSAHCQLTGICSAQVLKRGYIAVKEKRVDKLTTEQPGRRAAVVTKMSE